MDPEAEARRSPDNYMTGYPDMVIDAGVAHVTITDFRRLSTYSTSVPTGVVVGKVWKRGPHGGPRGFRHQAPLVEGNWLLGRYEDCAEDGYALTTFVPLVVDLV